MRTSRDRADHPRRRAAALAAAAALVLTGCDGASQGSEANPGGSTPTAGEPTASSSESHAPATGKPVETKYFTARAPRGWTVTEISAGFAITAQPQSGSSVIAFGIVPVFGNSFGLDELARHSLRSHSWTRKPEVLAHGEIAGKEAYHLKGPIGRGMVGEVLGVAYRGRQIEMDVETDGSAAEQREIVDSVLASWQWK